MPPGSPASSPEIDSELTRLQHESDARAAELRAIAAQLPAVVGRRAMVRTLVGDLVTHTDKRELVRRVVGRARRVRQALRSATDRFRARPPSPSG